MSKSRNIVVAIIIGLLILAFALWGSEDALNPQTDNTILSIGEERININEFRRAHNNQIRSFTERAGRALTDDETRQLANMLVSSFLRDKILLTDAKDLGIGYNARTARQELEKIEMFQDPFDKTFSAEQAALILGRQGLTTEDYAEMMISDNVINQVAPAINKGILPPEEFAEIAYDFKLESRETSVLTLTEEAVSEAPEPTDEELQTFIDEQVTAGNTRFIVPEYRRISMIRMEPTDFRYMDEDTLFDIDPELAKTSYNNIFVSEEEIDEQYELKVSAENLGTPATRSLVIYQAETEDAANTIVEKINAGLTQEEITALLGLQQPQLYTNVEDFEVFDEKIAEAAFDMKAEETRAVYGALENWVAFQVTAATDEVKPSKESIRDEVLEAILEQKRLDVIYKKMGKLQDEIENGRTLEEAAQLLDLPFTTMPYIDRQGVTQDELTMMGAMRMPGVASDGEILRFIFTSNIGTEVDIFDTTRSGSAMIRVDSVIDETPKTFEQAKALATIMWKDEFVENELEQLVQDVSIRVTAGETLADIEASFEKGATLSQETILRNQKPDMMGMVIYSGLIEGLEGDEVLGRGTIIKTRQIAILDKIIPNKTPIPDAERTTELDRITAEIAQDIQQAYQTAVIQEHPYTTNEEALNRVLGLDSPAQ